MLGVGFERCKKMMRRVLLTLFLTPTTTNKRKHSNQPKLTTHPIQSHPLTQREKWGKNPLSREIKLLCACFVAVPVTWTSFASVARELRRGALTMPETHIVMNSLIFCLALTLAVCLTLFLVLCLISLMDLTIAHMVLIHERTVLCLDALVMVHVLIVVIVSHVGLVSLLEVSHSL
jgi:hypothetical protein